MCMNTVTELAKKVNPCQRNFDLTQSIPQEHIDYILQAATSMPTKDNSNSYEIIVFTKEEHTRKLLDTAFDYVDMQGKKRALYCNGQVYSRCTILFSRPKNNDKKSSDESDMMIGIASASAALAAAELGYATGFCKCIHNKTINKFKKSIGLEYVSNPRLMLGIGIPNKNFDRHDIVIDNKSVNRKEARPEKNISITFA